MPNFRLIPPLSHRLVGTVLAVLVTGLCPDVARAQSPAGSAEDAMEILVEAAARYGEVDTVCADFRQLLSVRLLGQEASSQGELCQRRPNLFAMRFSDPDGDAVVADGTHFWIYYASVNAEQVLKVPLDPARGGLDFYREFLDAPRMKYEATLEGEEVVTGRPTARIALRPLAPRGYRSARVWIERDTGMIRKVEVDEENGTLRTVEMDRIRVNPPLPPDAFTFRVPEGVQVIAR